MEETRNDAVTTEETVAPLGSQENPMSEEEAQEAGIDTEAAAADAEFLETDPLS